MSRIYHYRGFLFLLLLLIVLSTACKQGSKKSKSPERPNIILISADTLRADHLGCYGYPRSTSPNLDKISRQTFHFSEVISASSHTLPSHASLFLSQHCPTHGVVTVDRSIPASQSTLPEMLKGKGYATAGFYAGPFLSPRYGFNQGFDVYESGSNGDAVSSAAHINQKALAWLDSDHDRPFFLFLHYFDIHYPFNETRPGRRSFSKRAPLSDRPELYYLFLEAIGRFLKSHDLSDDLLPDGADYQRRKKRLKVYRQVNDQLRIAGISDTEIDELWLWPWDGEPKLYDDQKRYLKDRYDDGIAFFDFELARLWKGLVQRNLADNSIIIILSDHGEMLYDHDNFLFHGRYLYDSLLKVPLFMKFPGLTPSVITQRATTVDIVPTILALSSITPPSLIQGISLVPPISGRSLEDDITFFSEIKEGDRVDKVAIRKGSRKLILDRLKQKNELYNLEIDPAETDNLIKKGE